MKSRKTFIWGTNKSQSPATHARRHKLEKRIRKRFSSQQSWFIFQRLFEQRIVEQNAGQSYLEFDRFRTFFISSNDQYIWKMAAFEALFLAQKFSRCCLLYSFAQVNKIDKGAIARFNFVSISG
jgi:hypothetical protein